MNIINAVEKALALRGGDVGEIETVSAMRREPLRFLGKPGWSIHYSTEAMRTFDPGFVQVEVTDGGEAEVSDII
jgi:hypothetical protein